MNIKKCNEYQKMQGKSNEYFSKTTLTIENEPHIIKIGSVDL